MLGKCSICQNEGINEEVYLFQVVLPNGKTASWCEADVSAFMKVTLWVKNGMV